MRWTSVVRKRKHFMLSSLWIIFVSFYRNSFCLRNKNEKLCIIVLVICRVSLTGHIYHRAAERRGDKFDRSMTRGKLLDNDTQLFIFISILIMTQLHPRDPENRQQKRFMERRFSKKKPSYNRLNGKAKLGLLPVSIYRDIMPSSCPLT